MEEADGDIEEAAAILRAGMAVETMDNASKKALASEWHQLGLRMCGDNRKLVSTFHVTGMHDEGPSVGPSGDGGDDPWRGKVLAGAAAANARLGVEP